MSFIDFICFLTFIAQLNTVYADYIRELEKFWFSWSMGLAKGDKHREVFVWKHRLYLASHGNLELLESVSRTITFWENITYTYVNKWKWYVINSQWVDQIGWMIYALQGRLTDVPLVSPVEASGMMQYICYSTKEGNDCWEWKLGWEKDIDKCSSSQSPVLVYPIGQRTGLSPVFHGKSFHGYNNLDFDIFPVMTSVYVSC